MTLQEFVDLAKHPEEEILRYQRAGLLDPDGDGRFDEYDVLRLRMILVRLDEGLSVEDILAGIRELPTAPVLFPPPGGGYSIEDAAIKTDLHPDLIVEVRTALGFPGHQLDEYDLRALEAVKTMIDGGMPEEIIMQGARVLGDAMRRFAETEIRLTHAYVHEPLAREGLDGREVARRAHQLVETAVMPVIEPLILFVHAKHLMRASVEDALYHLESADKPSVGNTIDSTILFVDLSSFTTIAHVHGDEVAANILERFDGLVRTLVLQHHGTLVKQIGDAFMLAFGRPADAVGFALDLGKRTENEVDFPPIRIGIHAGPVLYRVGDYVGNTVNIASRIATSAMPHEIVVTQPVASEAQAAGIRVEEAGVRILRGIDEPLALFRVIRARTTPLSRDPVCGMMVGDDAFGRLARDEREYVFCSEDCLRRFLEDPARYITATIG